MQKVWYPCRIFWWFLKINARNGQYFWLFFYSKGLSCLLKAVDVGLVVYDSTFDAHNSTTKSNTIRPYVLRSQEYVPYATSVPILSIYNHLIIYLFLPIHRQLVAVALGSLATLISLSLFVAIEFSHQEVSIINIIIILYLIYISSIIVISHNLESQLREMEFSPKY